MFYKWLMWQYATMDWWVVLSEPTVELIMEGFYATWKEEV